MRDRRQPTIGSWRKCLEAFGANNFRNSGPTKKEEIPTDISFRANMRREIDQKIIALATQPFEQ